MTVPGREATLSRLPAAAHLPSRKSKFQIPFPNAKLPGDGFSPCGLFVRSAFTLQAQSGERYKMKNLALACAAGRLLFVCTKARKVFGRRSVRSAR